MKGPDRVGGSKILIKAPEILTLSSENKAIQIEDSIGNLRKVFKYFKGEGTIKLAATHEVMSRLHLGKKVVKSVPVASTMERRFTTIKRLIPPESLPVGAMDNAVVANGVLEAVICLKVYNEQDSS